MENRTKIHDMLRCSILMQKAQVCIVDFAQLVLPKGEDVDSTEMRFIFYTSHFITEFICRVKCALRHKWHLASGRLLTNSLSLRNKKLLFPLKFRPSHNNTKYRERSLKQSDLLLST